MKSVIFVFLICATAFFSLSQQVILEESFDNGIPASWSIIDGDGLTVHPSVVEFQPAWIGLTDPEDASRKIVGSTSYFEPEDKAFRLLVTPQLSLGSYGNILTWQSKSHDPSFPDWIMILVSTTGNNLEDFTDTLFRLNNEFPYWTERSLNLSDSGYVDMNVYLAFVNHTNKGFKLYVDDVKVEINNPVKLEENVLSDIQIYPNPSASDFVFLKNFQDISALEIIDSSGRLVKSISNPESKIDVSQLQQGVYFVKCITNSGVQTLRYIRS